MTKAELKARNMLRGGANAFDYADDASGMVPATGDKLKLGQMKYNPSFVAQFDITFRIYYFSVAVGVYTSRTAAYILATAPTLAVSIAAFLFGNGDFASGFKKSSEQFPINNSVWTYGVPFIYGRDVAATSLGALDATGYAQLQKGDLVIPYTGTSGGVTYAALMVLHCNQVGYGTLLDALNSDRFWLNNIRYVVDNTAAGLAQYQNTINIQNQSLFGKFSSDTVSPDSFKQPEQFQNGIVDIPIEKGVDKNVVLATYVNYNQEGTKWSVFVQKLDKLTA